MHSAVVKPLAEREGFDHDSLYETEYMAAQLWIEETDKKVWHLANGKTAPMRYTVVCGWLLNARPTRVWPQKSYEPGPPRDDRCRSCIGEE